MQDTENSDEALLTRIASSDKRAMQILYNRHQTRVYRYLLRQSGNHASAEDLTSDVFLDVWRQAGSFEGRSSVSTWLIGMARYKALAAYRKKSEAPLDEDFSQSIEDATDTPEISMAKQDKGAVMRHCLTLLSPEHRDVIDLLYYHEKSLAEMALLIGVPEATIKTRVFYARKKLADIMKAHGIDRGWP